MQFFSWIVFALKYNFRREGDPVLSVEREVSDIDRTGGLEDRWRHPSHCSVAFDNCFGFLLRLEVTYCRVVKDNVRAPDLLGGNAHLREIPKLARIPLQKAIPPRLLQP